MVEYKRVAETADRLKEALRVSGKKQIDIARETGIDKGSISNYTSGRYEPKLGAIKKIAAALDVDEMWLWGYDVPMERGNTQNEKPATDKGSGLSKSQRELMQFAEGLSEEEAAQVLQTMKLLVQGLRK